MDRNSLFRARSGAVLAALLASVALTAGCAAASAPAPAATRPASTTDHARASTAARSTSTGLATTAAGRGRVGLIDYQRADGPTSQVILTGAIGDYGKAVSVYPNGHIDPDHTADLRLELTRGSFLISIAALDPQIVSAFRHSPPDLSTCSGTVRASGAAPIVTGSGTGAYRSVRGSFHVTIAIAEVDNRVNCSASSPPLAQVVFLSGSGVVS